MSIKRIQLPMTAEDVRSLKAGDSVLLNGPILTGRDAAHKRLVALLDEGKELPVEVKNQTIYYVGPAPASPGHAVGSAGPTTSYRMDAYAPRLMEIGLNGMIGKGKRNEAVVSAMHEHGAVYFGAIGGCGALLSRCIKKAEVIAYEDLGAEAIRRLEVENFPVVVIIDSEGNNLYETGKQNYLASL